MISSNRQTDPQAVVAGTQLPDWKLARRGRIMRAALDALKAQEYEQIQIRQIAEVAGVALGTLYRYFNSKEHLYASVIVDWAAPVIGGAVVDERPAEVRVRNKVRGIISAFERRPQFFKVCIVLQNSADPDTKALMSDFFAQLNRSLTGDLAALGEDAATDAAMMLWSIVNTTVGGSVFYGQPFRDAYRLCDAFIDLVAPHLPEDQRH